MDRKYDVQKYVHKLHSHRALFFLTIVCLVLNILLNVSTDSKAQKETNVSQLSVNKRVSLYSEIFLGDEQTPLFLFGREILSSNDIIECSSQQDVHHILQTVIQEGSGQAFDNTLSSVTRSMQSLDTEQSYLLGFPLVALNKPLILGGTNVKFSYPTQSSKNIYNRMFSQHSLKGVSTEAKAKLKNSSEECFLDFVRCGKKDHCLFDDHDQVISHIKIPVLGLSQKHQAVIIDPAEFGSQLKSIILRVQNHPSSFIPNLFSIQASHSVIIDFSQSTLIFDIIKTLELYPWNYYNRYRYLVGRPPPQVTSRWFIKFGLETENDFVSRPPTQGVEYLTTNPALYGNVFIYRQNISPESPKHFYVKNFPDEHKEAVRQAFQYWNSIYTSLKGYPAFSYTFIQGDYDGQQEIMIGDVRYNVMEWNNNKFPLKAGLTSHRVDHENGEILSVHILIQGSYIVDEYSKWFRYSEMVRANEAVREGNFANRISLRDISTLLSKTPINRSLYQFQVNLLAPQRETAESYIFNSLKYSVAHELGHGLGLGHNYKASVFMQDNIPYSVMDYLSTGDSDNFRYETNPNNYDRMALAYGYSGMLPEYTDRSCSENEIVRLPSSVEERKSKSPECNRNDATNFPLENAADKLKSVLDLLINRKDDQSFPYLIWNQSVDLFVNSLVFSIVFYHFSADIHYNQLHTVLIDGRKPKSPQEVKDLVIDYLTPVLCDSRLSNILTHQIPEDIFDRYLYSNAMQFKRRSDLVIFYLTDINTISCPDGRLVFERSHLSLSRFSR